jgi:hypothetical protein
MENLKKIIKIFKNFSQEEQINLIEFAKELYENRCHVKDLIFKCIDCPKKDTCLFYKYLKEV